MITGRCLCQAIRYECAGEPILIAHCHCESCRRQTSSPVTTFILVPSVLIDKYVIFLPQPSGERQNGEGTRGRDRAG